MSRGGTRQFAALLAAVLAAALLAACGGSSDSTSSSGGSTSSEAADQASEGTGGSSGSGGAKGGGTREKSADGNGSGGSKKADVATPLKVSGGGSQQFIVKGGDNSVQEFGEESDESELQEAADAVHGFFVARAEGRWADACSHLSASLLEQLEQLAEKSERKGCASFLSSFTTKLPPAVWREITTVDAGSLRREGEQGFLVYYGAPEKTVYSMPIKEEDGQWKVGALAGSSLSPPK
ncbi:MAG: hypothetical protein ACRDLL_07105 [Solirubrobacterales bacterium]